MKKILLVEDEPDEAKSMRMVLEGQGYAVELARDGREAVEKVANCDLVVLDIILPRLSGDAVLREMKKRNIRKPVVVVTAVSREIGVEEDLRKIKRDIAFLQKPFSSDSLVAAVSAKLK